MKWSKSTIFPRLRLERMTQVRFAPSFRFALLTPTYWITFLVANRMLSTCLAVYFAMFLVVQSPLVYRRKTADAGHGKILKLLFPIPRQHIVHLVSFSFELFPTISPVFVEKSSLRDMYNKVTSKSKGKMYFLSKYSDKSIFRRSFPFIYFFS